LPQPPAQLRQPRPLTYPAFYMLRCEHIDV